MTAKSRLPFIEITDVQDFEVGCQLIVSFVGINGKEASQLVLALGRKNKASVPRRKLTR